MLLYHLTSKSNLDSILQNGLIPQIGNNSLFAGEESPIIYLCESCDIPIWSTIFKNYDICITVEIDEDSIEEREYGFYSDYRYKEIIPVSGIIEWKENKYQKNKKLDTFYYNTMVNITRHTINSVKLSKKHVNDIDLPKYIQVILNMDIQFKDLFTQEELIDVFIDIKNSGDYSIFDISKRSKIKIYEELLNIHNPITDLLYQYIVNQFYGCLHLNTSYLE